MSQIIKPSSSSGPPPPTPPNSVLSIFDDFLGGARGWLGWTTPGAGANGNNNPLNTNPGTLDWPSGATNDILILYSIDESSTPMGAFVLGGGKLSLNWVINLHTLSNITDTYTFYCGLGDAATIAQDELEPQSGTYFVYTDSLNSGNYVIRNGNSGTYTSGDTNIVVAPGYVNYGITINAAGTSVAYFINGTQVNVSPLTSNIPTAALAPFAMVLNSAGNTTEFSIDLFYLTLDLTTAR